MDDGKTFPDTVPKKWVLHVLIDDMGFRTESLAAAIMYPHDALLAFRSGALADDPITYNDIRLKLHDIALMTSRLGRHRGKNGGSRDEAALFEDVLIDACTGWDLYSYLDGQRCQLAARPPDRQRVRILRTNQWIEASHNGLCALAIGEPPELALDRFLPDWRTGGGRRG